MTNLTSEQYRDVLKKMTDRTEKIPTVQHLLRKAVELFFQRFGGYPEIGGVAPGKVCFFGEQTQFSDGKALPIATPMATIVVGKKAAGNRYTVVTSADVDKPHKVKFSFSRNRPLAPGCPAWLNLIKGVIDNYEYPVPPFEAAIESSVPMGVSFGSTSAIEVATYSFVEVLVGRKSIAIDKAKACQKAEAFAGKEVGLVDRVTSILAKDRHVMLIDCKSNEVEWVSFRHPEIVFVAVDSHERDTLLGEEYPERARYWRKACEILGIESLRDCNEEDLLELENRVNEIIEDGESEEIDRGEEGTLADVWSKEEYDVMMKRARFFVTEMMRIREATDAWQKGDIESFGEKMNESHKALIEDFDFNNPLLNFLVETSLQVEGVLGSRMTGMGLGFGGAIISMIKKENIEEYCKFMMKKFVEYESHVTQDLKEARIKEKAKQRKIKQRLNPEHFDPFIASSERIGRVREYMEAEGQLIIGHEKTSTQNQKCTMEKKTPCIIKVEKTQRRCGTWVCHENKKSEEEFLRKKSLKKEEERRISEERRVSKQESSGSDALSTLTQISNVSEVKLTGPSFYLLSPFAGARVLFVTKTDILRSHYANPLPHPKSLVRESLNILMKNYGTKPEAVGLAPATATLFGEFMEFHLGYIICMALSMYTVTVGGRNDTVCFSFKTLATKVEQPWEMKCPLPCVRPLEMESRSWVNYSMGTVNEFKGHVPGFNAVVGSSVPIQTGVNSCAAFQASIYTFLENLTRDCTLDSFEKADRCGRSEYEFLPTPNELVTRCSSIKFFPTFLCREGHMMLVNCKRYKICHYFFDHPAYAFLIVCCKKNKTDVTVESLELRLEQCMKAIEILGRNSLIDADLKHLRYLKKRNASEEVIKRARYVITEHQRTVEAVKAIKNEDYARVGTLMNQSHASLRDDYEVSSPQIESLVKLAKGADGVLGVKMLGKGLNATIIILIRLSDADKCMLHMRKNCEDKKDRPIFYLTKPSRGAFMMNPDKEVPMIP